jgi:hypothetical protein
MGASNHAADRAKYAATTRSATAKIHVARVNARARLTPVRTPPQKETNPRH